MWVQGWGGRAGTNGLRSEMTSAHLRARHTPPASSEMAGVLGCSFLLTSGRRRAVMQQARRDYECDTVGCRRERPAATRLRGLWKARARFEKVLRSDHTYISYALPSVALLPSFWRSRARSMNSGDKIRPTPLLTAASNTARLPTYLE
jgi:hypothetical protein